MRKRIFGRKAFAPLVRVEYLDPETGLENGRLMLPGTQFTVEAFGQPIVTVTYPEAP